ncbi:hypothetical protein VNI00_003169 [Paramarasmius palmivorus]|uniref:Uncharacterized protein n=1 Tax=Paramarasmius palmivorus TaxID=297713 RepID=A0AAW0DPA3_9AGAR
MYSPRHLDSPPPPAQFRRPWSPDPNDPLPSFSRNHIPDSHDDYDFDFEYSRYPHRQQQQQQRREPSDVSVEALDLADYARTLARPQRTAQGMVPDNMLNTLHPPSLYHGDTPSSSSQGSSSRRSRPFSLPPRSRSSRSPAPEVAGESKIDISHFPVWSRNWYTSNRSQPEQDIYSPVPQSQFDSVRYGHKKNAHSNPFDPSHTFNYHRNSTYNSWDRDPFSTNTRSRTSFPDYPPPPASSHGHDSFLPWSRNSPEPPSYSSNRGDGYIDPETKEERIRMLEREFGTPDDSRPTNSKGVYQDDSGELVDHSGNLIVGSVDRYGNLVTAGPKKRTFLRFMQVVLAGTAGIPAIYAALAIKPGQKDDPPPKGTAQAYVLYVVGALTLVGLVGLGLFSCCCRRRKGGKKGGPGMAEGGMGGMMVLPVVQGLGGKKKKKNKYKKGKMGAPPGQDVQVNLIVDPTMFGGGRRDDEEEEEESLMPGGYGPQSKRKKPKRRSVFVGLAMETDWMRARGWLKKMTALDVFGVIVWGAVFVFVVMGKKCPVGDFDGW